MNAARISLTTRSNDSAVRDGNESLANHFYAGFGREQVERHAISEIPIACAQPAQRLIVITDVAEWRV